MAGAKVQFTATPFNSVAPVSAGAVAGVSYVAPCDVMAYRPSGEGLSLLADVTYTFKMFDDNGVARWNNEVHGTVVTTGLNKLLDATLKTGLASPAWYCLLIDGTSAPVITMADTMASHAGWTENTDYSETTRPALTLGTIANGAVDNSASQAQYTFTASGTIAGAAITSVDTKGDNTGILYDAGIFADGYRTFGIGWALYLAVTCSITAA